jgi:hypothetical protein
MHPRTNSPTRAEYVRLGAFILSVLSLPFIVWNAINSR